MTVNKDKNFLGDAIAYQQTRPDYPPQLYARIRAFWQTHNPNKNSYTPVIVDVGSGTGIAARGIATIFKNNCQVIGIEPDASMLAQAIQATSSTQPIHYQQGHAETLPFADASIDVVIVAQAMQYFDRPKFYEEVKRILQPESGVLAILENNRDWRTNLFLQQYEEFLEKYASDQQGVAYRRDYRAFPFMTELKEYFYETAKQSFSWQKYMTPAEFLQLIQSTTSAQKTFSNIGQSAAEKILKTIMQSHLNAQQQLTIDYLAKVYLAAKLKK